MNQYGWRELPSQAQLSSSIFTLPPPLPKTRTFIGMHILHAPLPSLLQTHSSLRLSMSRGSDPIYIRSCTHNSAPNIKISRRILLTLMHCSMLIYFQAQSRDPIYSTMRCFILFVRQNITAEFFNTSPHQASWIAASVCK